MTIPLLLSSITAYAGIDWSRYDDGPVLFFGWETSLYFAIAAVILFGVSGFLSNLFRNDQGSIEGGGVGCFICIINIAMIICAICSFYLLIPLVMIFIFLRGNKK